MMTKGKTSKKSQDVELKFLNDIKTLTSQKEIQALCAVLGKKLTVFRQGVSQEAEKHGVEVGVEVYFEVKPIIKETNDGTGNS